jgi:hypothetical protein
MLDTPNAQSNTAAAAILAASGDPRDPENATIIERGDRTTFHAGVLIMMPIWAHPSVVFKVLVHDLTPVAQRSHTRNEIAFPQLQRIYATLFPKRASSERDQEYTIMIGWCWWGGACDQPAALETA